jgi:hypothetical protein
MTRWSIRWQRRPRRKHWDWEGPPGTIPRPLALGHLLNATMANQHSAALPSTHVRVKTCS